MENQEILMDAGKFCQKLHLVMREVAPVVDHMEPYEFRYCLNNITPTDGKWDSVTLDSLAMIEAKISSNDFFDAIQIKPKVEGHIVLDETITRLTQMLFVGLVTDVYPEDWVIRNFFFDPRSFNFFVQSHYLTPEIKTHLGSRPYRSFEAKQKHFEQFHEVGYQDFQNANLEVDQCFIEIVLKLIQKEGVPVILAIAGPTAAGKTEIVERLSEEFAKRNQRVAAIELDNFLTDRDGREEKGIGSFGKAALHFDLFQACIRDILSGKKISTPRYDFIDGTSSHTLDGKLKPGRSAVEIEPADVIFLEGNSPFLLPEIAPLIGVKVVYLTDDPIRLKRKWRRDIDYRKKYDPYYFRNRFFKEQPPMAVKNYQPQLLACDVYVNTTNAEVWVTQQVVQKLE